MTICFLMPFYQGCVPVGGLKMVLLYANMLAADGHDVIIVYPYWCNYFVSKPLWRKVAGFIRYQVNRSGWMGSDKWFEKHSRVKEIEVYSLNYKFIPKADIYIATSVETSDYVKDYPNMKYYFIQGYENWNRSDADLIRTYHYPLHNIAISKWLQNRVKASGAECDYVPNGFELNNFYVSDNIRKRSKTTICMLYHDQKEKNSLLGIRALEIVHHKYPSVVVNMFGKSKRPANLPEWYNYIFQATSSDLLKIYNGSSIYVGTSDSEGWGLTVGEAMLCGDAVACTDIGGYKEMASDGVNALISPCGDAESMAENIISLIEDKELRVRLATRAAEDMKKYSIEESYEKFKAILFLN